VSQSAGSISAATLNVDGADGGCNDGVGTPYCTIGAAVGDANPGDTINVFPGTYPENVDLNGMNVPGDISLTTVDATGTPTASTATISPSSGIAIFAFSPDFPGDIFISGFTVLSTSWGIDIRATGLVTLVDVTANNNGDDGANIGAGDVTISGSTANGNGDDGFKLDATGAVTISGTTANDNDQDGVDVAEAALVTISGSTANGNGDEGIDFDPTSLPPTDISISGSTANFNTNEGFQIDTLGNITVIDSTANDNGNEGDDGFRLDSGGDIVVCGVTAIGNSGDGIHTDEEGDEPPDNVSVTSSVVENNAGDGIDFDSDLIPANSSGIFEANGNNISGNNDGMDLDDDDVTVDATGNWWGDPSGPTHPNNPGGSGDNIEDSANNSSGTVVFDPFLTSPSADAGTCPPTSTPSPVPAAAPTAAPTAAPAALPDTGGTPSDGGSGGLAWLAAITGAIALMGAGSGLWLANQRRRVR
jgi:parallel beta-helix repeat protein